MNATAVDHQKANADILIKSANGGSFTIDPKGKEIVGRVIRRYDNGCVEVSSAQLDVLRRQGFEVACDF